MVDTNFNCVVSCRIPLFVIISAIFYLCFTINSHFGCIGQKCLSWLNKIIFCWWNQQIPVVSHMVLSENVLTIKKDVSNYSKLLTMIHCWLWSIADYDPLLTMIHSQFNLNRDSAQSASHDFPLELGGGYHVLLLLPITILICFETIILLSLLSLPATVIIKYFFFHHNEWGATFPLPHCLFPFWSLGLHHFPMKLSNYA